MEVNISQLVSVLNRFYNLFNELPWQPPKLCLSQNPGDFLIFWHVLVPLSVLLNIHRFGLRMHELGLLVALNLNPLVLEVIMQNFFLAWLAVLFLIIWTERILRRWAWYHIYSWRFFSSLVLLAVFLAVPSTLLRLAWRPVFSQPPGEEQTSLTSLGQIRDVAFLAFACLLLMHAVFLLNKKSRSFLKPKRHEDCSAKLYYRNR